jgi:hypothetical protein
VVSPSCSGLAKRFATAWLDRDFGMTRVFWLALSRSARGFSMKHSLVVLAAIFSISACLGREYVLLENVHAPAPGKLEVIKERIGAREQTGPWMPAKLWEVINVSAVRREIVQLPVEERPTVRWLGQDYRDIFITSDLLPPLSDIQRDIVAEWKKYPDTAILNIMEVVPAQMLNNALRNGYGRRDGFVEEGTINISLGLGNPRQFVKTHIGDVTDGLLWRGKSADQKGDAILFLSRDGISGTIKFSRSEIYVIKPIGSGLHVVVLKRTLEPFPEIPDAVPETQK